MAIGAAPAEAASHRVELVPMVGVRGGAELDADLPAVPPAEASPSVSFGLAVDVFVRPDAWYEVFIDHQTLRFTSDPATFGTSGFDLPVDYLQFGGGYGSAEGRVQPFVAAALGLTFYGEGSGEVKSTIAGSGSLGGGFRVPIGKRVSFRAEVRGYASFSGTAISVTCGPGCAVQFGASGWYQLTARAGVAIRL